MRFGSDRPAGPGTPAWPAVAAVLGGLLFAYYLVPLGALLFARPPGAVLGALTAPRVASAAVTSVVAATASTLLAAVLGLPLAYWLARTDRRIAAAVTGVVLLPLVLPPVVSGLLVLLVAGPGTSLGSLAAAGDLRLTGSLVGVVLAQTFVASPFVVVTATAAFAGVDARLEEAARTLGATPGGRVRRVTLPLAAPGVLAGLALAFARAMGEFGATYMVAADPETLPVVVYESVRAFGVAEALAVSVVLLAVAVATLALLARLGTGFLPGTRQE